MIQSFLAITFRILWRNKVTSVVNILTDIIYRPDANPENLKRTKVGARWSDSTAIDISTVSLLQGDPFSCLKNPFTWVIAESVTEMFSARR